MSNLKVEGKVGGFCPKCKNCKGVTNEYDGKTASIRLTEVECEDPYDGMIKTLAADSDVCCSMFEVRKEKEPFNLNMPREAIKAIAKLNNIISELEKEKAAHLKGIERLKKRAADSDYYKEKSELLEEKYIARGKDIDHLLSENKEKDKKISELEKLYNSLSETCADYDKRCKEECEKKYRDEISKLQNIVTEKHVEIKGLKKEIINLTFDRATVKDIMKKNIKFKETISDQEITIKALLITIKEMCKDE